MVEQQPFIAPPQKAEDHEHQRLSNRSPPTNCLSVEDHDHDITDPLAHFLGCIEIGERNDFFSDKNRIWKDELEYQQSLGNEQDGASELVKNLKERWKNNIDSELKRIALLRKTLAEEENDGPLVSAVDKSREEWRQSHEYQRNIRKVREWRQEHQMSVSNLEPEDNEAEANELEGYELEKDISVPVIQFDKEKEYSEDGFKGKFPNQKTTVHKLLYEVASKPEDELLHRNRDFNNGRIKYFHIPSNNMIWAEKAIARYFGDKSPDLSALNRHLQRPGKTNTSTILQERHWRGQLHGDSSSPPHARYLSPMCETITSPSDTANPVASNIALFMPYLHWETSRKREQFASEIDVIVTIEAREKAKNEAKTRLNRQKRRRSLPDVQQNHQDSSCHHELPSTAIRSFEQAVEAKMKKQNEQRKFQSKHKLGRYLLAAAHLCEAIKTYRDKKLLRKYLPLDPPLHPRRTLDQSFYWTLNSTEKRDKDQVVYRGTTATRNDFHQRDENDSWPDHPERFNGTCETCRASIQKVSRVIMVDQLWMWVLDEKTIITCFPKRYGANKQDHSGVHKSIRNRLESLSPDPIRTVFELALIILEECTGKFFDRAKSLDKQPQVIDEFSKAIGNIMHRQTLAFNRLWSWTRDARKIYRSQAYTDTTELHVPLLDINPEGHLEREIEDIIEELDIMLHIANINKDIIKSFIEQAENILNPDGGLDKIYEHKRTRQKHKTKQVEKERDYHAFKRRANECQDRVNTHVKDLESLRKSAKNAADDVLHLLSMKQQQASVVQAWQAVNQSNETIRQGRSILVFTLATIVFLPLSFLTSVFGMNNREFANDNWSLRSQFLYIFLISAGVVFISLLFAYSAWIRACVWSLCTQIMTKLILKTRIYEWNLEYRKHSDDIFYDTYERMNALKTDKKKALLKRKHEKREKEKGDGEEREKEKPERQEPEREQPGEQDRPANTSRELTNSMNGDGGSSVMGYNILRTSTRWLRGSQATFNSEPV